jgi:hypothetical protein
LTVRFWPKDTVGLCYRKTAVGILNRNLRSSLRARERIHAIGQEPTFACTTDQSFEGPLTFENGLTASVSISAEAYDREPQSVRVASAY